jgi:hypothetical protein
VVEAFNMAFSKGLFRPFHEERRPA